jgi:hypothetical protein
VLFPRITCYLIFSVAPTFVLWPCIEPQTSTELQHREHVLEVLVLLCEEEHFFALSKYSVILVEYTS